MKKGMFFGLVAVLLAAGFSAEVFAGGGHRGGSNPGWHGNRGRVVVVQRRGGNSGLRDLGILGLGVGGGILLDRYVLRPDPYYPIYGPTARPVYGPAYPRAYGSRYDLPSCADLPTDVEQDRCEKAQQRAAEREQERIVRERLRNAERLGEELGRSRY
ncbi:hypothetical protein A3I27_01040 [Candidatus Giovannonibacteria bacterium RIFCSPLOWO2_02_FULL_43_11b]|uniref:Uncharacterized protein n=1 Tax=Candidatus Giovannonibacteria bacterium RIFCSPHIGHO2_12_FULL_43_15 TaxID=1798341 RepID=A0A1F5WPF1_9BACT|nr:MAG: hypothetical protein A2739_01245 [Candidatus Giovannonibacteria bacterium RIFCSPHIGHO2_01_FULL_43_100]OGF66760.1 MAG: hypothetical protein A3B97_02505 [Candidatus Giovannonibacteria bacterium RIFCSPHIGHO2_02_FULL_43_32]OGF77536.1 MAG: hypothetical protein A3F23_01000 [Candidatus Giovannonibacteria bacterium RIFCSPHIGHO2_12_FULL_43_15]OGF78997.1 MAG: hypothetical protein A3A15_00625 [Candidatus Giovannonibacteria bacterium RIFCSPLOWO2_01_FULL_43_60]OGF90389.1 MAG: hypothetical protein A3